MGSPAAKMNDQVVGTCLHVVMVPAPPGPPVPTPLPHAFNGMIISNLSSNVLINNLPAATIGSIAQNLPPHAPTPPGTSFVTFPANMATIQAGSATVLINNKPAARSGDRAQTCSEAPIPANVIAAGNVLIG